MTETHKRTAIVTGASSGIGEAIVRRFISEGFGVVGNGRNADKLESLEKELGGTFRGVAGDAADEACLENLFAAVEKHFNNGADIVVANAGRGLGGSVKDADLSEFQEMMQVNVTGALILMQKAARRMMETQAGSFPETAADIVITGSVVGRHVSPFSATYGASKFAIHSLTEGLRREVSPMGVRVSLVEPGLVFSGFQSAAGYPDEMVKTMADKFGPIPEADDIADAVYYIVSRPPHVHVCDIVVRPTRQDYP
ncbi:SDR family oxidoreductase [Desulfobacula sp.]|uniref:SDR family oxidoreductase n=1 Tax=Desulfobacula sp. TaxID=2593537 RepID=UPI002601E839|nr:SDR family oxidoreductase [Desulfobacula sp.]